MGIIIEDGSGVVGANSYGVDAQTPGDTLTAARSFGVDRGVIVPVDDPTLTAYLILGTQWLEFQSSRFVGRQVSPTQALSFPRIIRLGCTLLPTTPLPAALLNALYQLCIEQTNGIPLMPSTDNSLGGFVVRRKTDVLETQFSERIGTGKAPLLPAVDNYLKSLFYQSSGFGIPVVRV